MIGILGLVATFFSLPSLLSLIKNLRRVCRPITTTPDEPPCYFNMRLEPIPSLSEERRFLDKLRRLWLKLDAKEEIYVTIEFNKQWQQLGVWGLGYGLKGGKLKLELEGCRMLVKDRLSISSNTSDYQLSISEGTTKELSLVFNLKMVDQPVTINERLGIFQIDERACSIKASFIASKQDVHLHSDMLPSITTNRLRNISTLLGVSLKSPLIRRELRYE